MTYAIFKAAGFQYRVEPGDVLRLPSLEAEAGDILLGPADVPHKYHNLGPGLLESTDIHLSDRWIQTDLDDPELSGA